MSERPTPRFFRSGAELRTWLEKNHASKDELHVGIWKKATGKATVAWPDLVDQLLCFGWIDGIVHSIDESRYSIRVTPRRRRSNWSRKNIARMAELIDLGWMTPAGLAAFEARDEARSGVYSFERTEEASLGADLEKRFRRRRGAWKWFESQPPGYRRSAIHWVVSAKREETRARRFDTLVADSERGERVPPLRR